MGGWINELHHRNLFLVQLLVALGTNNIHHRKHEFHLVDLGPQDHGWCAGYSCQRRLSLFHSIVALSRSYEVYFTGTSPQNLRLMLLNIKHDKVRQDGNNCLRVIGVNYLLIFLSAKDFISSPVLLKIISHSSFSRIIGVLPRILLAQTIFIGSYEYQIPLPHMHLIHL